MEKFKEVRMDGGMNEINREGALRMAIFQCLEKYEDVANRILFDIEKGKQYTDNDISNILFRECADFSRMVEPTIALYLGELENADIFTREMGWGGKGRLSDWQYAITEAILGDFFAFNSGKMREEILNGNNPYTEIKRHLSLENMKKVVKFLRKWILLER